jgi:adenine/guanine phosphoribosyltransferase-like PRPP-binding protein
MRGYYGYDAHYHADRVLLGALAREVLREFAEGVTKIRCAEIDGPYLANAVAYAIEHRWMYREIQDGIAYYVTNQEAA